MARPMDPFDSRSGYQAPQKTLVPCPQCGTTVLVRTWSHDKGWNLWAGLLLPVTGEEHQCNGRSAGAQGMLPEPPARHRNLVGESTKYSTQGEKNHASQ